MTSQALDTSPLLENLTDPQRQAVTHVDGPLLVLAGAGSGKTRVITRRIAHLVKGVGIAPWNVLAITFTNKAAGEMQQRVAQLLSERQARAATVCTFHSLCARVLRQHGPLVGLTPGFSIYDSGDQQRLMKKTLDALQISATNFPPGKILATVSSAKNELTDAAAFAAAAGGFYEKTVAKIFSAYSESLRKANAVDFDDLLLLTVRLLREHPAAAEQLRDRFQYILIDEYQDTNHAQFVLAGALAWPRNNLCATGDPDQSIYGWRGANIRNILEFESHYPQAKVVRLEQNYRSTQRILAAADHLIRHNQRRKHKELWTQNEPGDPVTVATCQDERDEAQWVVQRFAQLHDSAKIPWSGMAVFYRINSLSRVVEDAFRKAVVPYQVARGTAFYERKEVKDAVAYLRVVLNPADEVNLARIVNFPPRGISDATVKALQTAAVAQGGSLYNVMRSASRLAALSARAAAAVQRFANQLNAWRAEVGLEDPLPAAVLEPHSSLRFFVERVLRDSGLEDYYRNDSGDVDQERLANLGELVSSVQQFEQDPKPGMYPSPDKPPDSPPASPPDAPDFLGDSLLSKLSGYLEQVSLVSDTDRLDGPNASEGAVTLMTLHAAKGLEFPVVAIVGVEEGLLPHERARQSQDELEEERRLCFVGITRARRLLSLSRARFRSVFGQTTPTRVSPFVRELPPEAVVEETTSSDLDWSDPTPAHCRDGLPFEIGSRVRHPQFGQGTVMEVTAHRDPRVKVFFPAAGVKTLVLEFARLERLG